MKVKAYEWIVTLESTIHMTVRVRTDGAKPTDEEIHSAARYTENHLSSSSVEEYDIVDVYSDEEEETTDD
jgi:hypothetical protein